MRIVNLKVLFLTRRTVLGTFLASFLPTFLFVSPVSGATDFLQHGAVGLGSVVSSRNSSDVQPFLQVAPEIVGYTYSHLYHDFWWRPAAWLSFAWNQPEVAQALRLKEYDARLTAEMGVVWSWVVVPSFTMGAGGLFRNTSLVVTDPIQVEESKMGGTRIFPVVYAQLGVGIPIEKGVVILEPYVRYNHIFGDSRYRWAYGVEATVSVF